MIVRILWQVSKCNKIDCEMNAQQSSYLPSVHHVMSHVTRDNCPSNKKAASSVRTYNQPSHVTSAKRKKELISTPKIPSPAILTRNNPVFLVRRACVGYSRNKV